MDTTSLDIHNPKYLELQPFAVNGFVSLRQVRSHVWQNAYRQLESFSSEFTDLFPLWGAGYPWPADPLHRWFRPFEYPYVLHNLPPIKAAANPVVVDIGPAVTFFSTLLADRGYSLHCLDSDPRMVDFWKKLKECAPKHWTKVLSRVQYQVSQEYRLPLASNIADAVICVSVLEHVSEPPKLLADMLRVLKPGGVLILTMDISLESDEGVSAAHFGDLCGLLDEHTIPAHPNQLVHPQELLVWPDAPEGLVPSIPTPENSSKASLIGRIMSRISPFGKSKRNQPQNSRSLCLFAGTYVKHPGC